jgi:hypothetical protein
LPFRMSRFKNKMAKVLSIIPYEFYPAKYGAALRSFHLLQEMATYFSLQIIKKRPRNFFTRPFAS